MELSAAEALAAKLAGGHWTHDYALTASEAATLGLTISPLARWLITTYDWRTAMLTIGVLAWSLLLPAALLVRRPPAVAATPAVGGGPGVTLDTVGMSAAQALRSPQFLVLGLTFFACCAAHSGPIFHMVSYAIFCGLAPMAAVSVYSVEGLAGLGGRLLLGLLGDRFGAKPVLIAGLLVQALAIGTYVFVSRLGEFYALAVVFGTAYGGVMPLYAVLAREYFGQRIMGTVFGAATMLSSIGMAFGPLAGGWIYDTFDAYSWLFLGSFAVGLGAVAVALAFPPLPRARLQPA
jgi:MFS family permease